MPYLKKLFLNPYTIFSLVIALGIVLLYVYVLNPQPAEVGQVIGSQTMLNEKGELVVKYAFISGEIDRRVSENVQKQAETSELKVVKEDVAKRTASSRTFVTDKPGTKIVEIIPGAQYYKDDKGNWWQADYKTATPEEFSKLPKSPEYARLTDTSRFAFIKRVFATTSTFYPDAGTGATTVDGRTYHYHATSWATARDGAGTGALASEASSAGLGTTTDGGSTRYIVRSFFSFDTSALTSGASISDATISIYATGASDQTATTNPSHPRIVGGTPAANNTLANGDYTQTGSTLLSDSTMTIATFAASAAYRDFALNATGLAAINKTGVTTFALRGKNDIDNTEPNAQSYAYHYWADQAGTTNDPKLVVVHATPATTTTIKDSVIFKDGVIFK